MASGKRGRGSFIAGFGLAEWWTLGLERFVEKRREGVGLEEEMGGFLYSFSFSLRSVRRQFASEEQQRELVSFLVPRSRYTQNAILLL